MWYMVYRPASNPVGVPAVGLTVRTADEEDFPCVLAQGGEELFRDVTDVSREPNVIVGKDRDGDVVVFFRDAEMLVLEERCEACRSTGVLRDVVLPSGRKVRICSQHDDNQVWERGEELDFLWNK